MRLSCGRVRDRGSYESLVVEIFPSLVFHPFPHLFFAFPSPPLSLRYLYTNRYYVSFPSSKLSGARDLWILLDLDQALAQTKSCVSQNPPAFFCLLTIPT